MARNRHPEQTVERILEEASRLFLQKGYEKTSMQDIMDATGQMCIRDRRCRCICWAFSGVRRAVGAGNLRIFVPLWADSGTFT